MENLNKILFCFGQGYCANNLVELLSAKGWVCFGSGRTKIQTKLFLMDKPLSKILSLSKPVTHILISIPPQNSHGDTVFHHLKDYKTKLFKVDWMFVNHWRLWDTQERKLMNLNQLPIFAKQEKGRGRKQLDEEFQKNHYPFIFRLPESTGRTEMFLINYEQDR